MLVEDLWDAMQHYAPSWLSQITGLAPQVDDPVAPNQQEPPVNNAQGQGAHNEPPIQGTEAGDIHRRIVLEESWDEARGGLGGTVGPIRQDRASLNAHQGNFTAGQGQIPAQVVTGGHIYAQRPETSGGQATSTPRGPHNMWFPGTPALGSPIYHDEGYGIHPAYGRMAPVMHPGVPGPHMAGSGPDRHPSIVPNPFYGPHHFNRLSDYTQDPRHMYDLTGHHATRYGNSAMPGPFYEGGPPHNDYVPGYHSAPTRNAYSYGPGPQPYPMPTSAGPELGQTGSSYQTPMSRNNHSYWTVGSQPPGQLDSGYHTTLFRDAPSHGTADSHPSGQTSSRHNTPLSRNIHGDGTVGSQQLGQTPTEHHAASNHSGHGQVSSQGRSQGVDSRAVRQPPGLTGGQGHPGVTTSTRVPVGSNEGPGEGGSECAPFTRVSDSVGVTNINPGTNITSTENSADVHVVQTGPQSPDPHVSSGRRKDIRPEKYDGSTDWLDYIKHFETVAAWNLWTPADKAAQLSINLTGAARQAWSDSGLTDLPTFDELKAVLKQRFKPEGQDEAFKAEFRHRVKRKDESFLEFGHALRRLAIRAFAAMEHTAREELLKDQFIQNLDGEMRRHVSLAHPTTLDRAIVMATEYDTVTNSLKSPLPQKPKVVAAVAETPSENTTVQILMKMMENLTKSIGQRGPQRPRSYANVECWGCQEKGHIRVNCPKSNQPTPEPEVKG